MSTTRTPRHCATRYPPPSSRTCCSSRSPTFVRIDGSAFSLFRRGPLVEETTISGNIKSLLRFLGYLHYEQRDDELQQLGVVQLDMSVFALPNISSLVL